MSDFPQPPADLVRAFGLTSPVGVAETDIARVWRAERSGEKVALKIYEGRDMRNEVHGFDLMRAMDGHGGVRVLAMVPGAVVMEWLDGPLLGDLARQGQDAEAAVHLGAVAQKIASAGAVSGLPHLSDWVADLLSLRCGADADSDLVSNIAHAQAIARALLHNGPGPRPLHGDLHHDNVALGPHGWTAFDAKGVLGDPTYEMANAFRNPKGASDLIRSPDRIAHCADVWSAALDLDRARLMRWAAVKVALSMAWRAGEVLTDDAEADLLSLMLNLADPP